MDRIMAREARKAERDEENGQPIYHPEDRMRENAWLGAIFYPLALVVYGWTVQKGVHWIVPVRDPTCYAVLCRAMQLQSLTLFYTR
jgi:hypothetical protein